MSRFLPSLSSLISVNDLPEELGFLQNAINTIFDDIYYDHYQKIASERGDSKTYNLDIILNKQLGLTIPGADISLLLNPNDNSNPQSTSFNITLSYELKILRLVNGFDFKTFSFNTTDLINLFLLAFEVDQSTILENISIHIKNPDQGTLGYIVYTINDLVDFFNDYYELTGTPNELVYTNSTTYQDIADGLNNAGITMATVISDFGITSDYPGGNDTLEDVFSKLDIERDSGPLTIQELVDELNADYSLTGTPNEIIYSASPETNYHDILTALSSANITLLQLIIDYIVPTSGTYEDISQILIDFFVEAKQTVSSGEYLNLLKPSISASVNDLNFAIEFPRTMLIPIDTDSNSPDFGKPISDTNIKSRLGFDVGNLVFSTENDFSFENIGNVSFTKSQIGNTGLILSFTDALLDLSRDTNIPEAIADGRPEDFIGVFIQQAEIDLPPSWFPDSSNTVKIIGTDLLIGTGGLSGTIGFDSTGTFKTNLGSTTGFSIGLDTFNITFQQNSIISSEIKGELTIPGFKDSSGTGDAKIGIDVHFGTDGSFDITATANQAVTIKIPNVLDFNIKSVEVGKDSSGAFFIAASGSIDFTADVPGLGGVLPKGIDIKKIIIHQNGTIELEGGTIVLPKAATLKVGPAKLSVTALGFGSYEREHGGTLRKYKYVEFSAGISVNPGGVDARGDGIKVYFTVDSGPLDIFVRIAGIGIDLVIPGNASKETAALLLDGNEYGLARAA